MLSLLFLSKLLHLKTKPLVYSISIYLHGIHPQIDTEKLTPNIMIFGGMQGWVCVAFGFNGLMHIME